MDSVADELAYRIGADTEQFGGRLPERYALAWRGYLAGLLEWGVLAPAAYDRLTGLVPEVADDPATQILRGRP
jgi:hypothetical protein